MVFALEFILRQDGIPIKWETLSSEEFANLKRNIADFLETNKWRTTLGYNNLLNDGKLIRVNSIDVQTHLNKQYTLGDYTIELVSSRIAKKIYKENPVQ